MRQKWTRHSYQHRQWEKHWGDYPDSAPRNEYTIDQSYSQDLEYTQNNHKKLLGKVRYAIGGPFAVTRRFYTEWNNLPSGPYKNNLFTHPFGYAEGVYDTPLFARYAEFGNSAFPMVTPTDPVELQAMGREAISKTTPTASTFDGATFLGEMREGLPYLLPWSTTTRKGQVARARNAGDNYLNIEFGWKPLRRDFAKFCNTVRNAESILDEYEKNSGKLLHRKYSWPVDSNLELIYDGLGFTAPLIDQTNLYEPGGYLGRLRHYRVSTTERWFSAAYTYFFPERGSSLRKSAELKKLYGLEISPDMIWNCAPWSWAADWIGDGGTLMKNVTNLGRDGLLMPWAYLMEKKSIEDRYMLDGIRFKTIPFDLHFRQTFKTELKTRYIASPYGFDVDWPDFNGKQLAILGALGVSRT